MKFAFHSVCSMGASFLSAEQRRAIALQAVTAVEKLKPFHEEVVIYDIDIDNRKVKVVVFFAKRELHIMTATEAAEAGLPDKPDLLTPSDN